VTSGGKGALVGKASWRGWNDPASRSERKWGPRKERVVSKRENIASEKDEEEGVVDLPPRSWLGA